MPPEQDPLVYGPAPGPCEFCGDHEAECVEREVGYWTSQVLCMSCYNAIYSTPEDE